MSQPKPPESEIGKWIPILKDLYGDKKEQFKIEEPLLRP
jgi:hypothetical protein